MSPDAQIVLVMNGLAEQFPLLRHIFIACADSLPYFLVALVVVFAFLRTGRIRERIEALLVIGAAGLASVAVVGAIRAFLHRPRPFLELPIHPLLQETSWSFPSQHATFFFALGAAVYLYDRRWGSLFLVAAGLVAVARVAAGVHYPSDVMGGAIIGTIIGWATVKTARFFIKKGNIATY